MLIYALLSLLGCNNSPDVKALTEMSCATGDADACYQLGLGQLNPPQGLPDISGARQTFAKGCAKRHANSCASLAAMVRDARGGPADLMRAGELFTIGCEEGKLADSCLQVAKLKYSQKLAGLDEEGSVVRFNTLCASEQPVPEACLWEGDAYETGRGVAKKDLAVAEQQYRRACELKYAEGCTRVANLYVKKTRKEDLAIAADFYSQACALDGHFGCYEIGIMHRDKRVAEPDMVKSGAYLQKACNIMPPKGCYDAAMLMENGLVPAREGEKAALFSLACEAGDADACTWR